MKFAGDAMIHHAFYELAKKWLEDAGRNTKASALVQSARCVVVPHLSLNIPRYILLDASPSHEITGMVQV
jgi:hypothetical protein